MSFVLGVSFLRSAGLPGAHCFPGSQPSSWVALRVLETAVQCGTGETRLAGEPERCTEARLALPGWLCDSGLAVWPLCFSKQLGLHEELQTGASDIWSTEVFYSVCKVF